jgi:hypothetical protein
VGWGGMDWIDLAQDRDRWRTVVYAVMNLQVPCNWLAEDLLVSQEGLCFVELVNPQSLKG